MSASFQRQSWPSRAVVTSGMPYGNKPLHFGHIAGVFVPADCYARFLRDRIGADNVRFVCGTDCFGSPIDEGYRKLVEAGEFDGTIAEYVQRNHDAQAATLAAYDISLDIYQGSGIGHAGECHQHLTENIIRRMYENGWLHLQSTMQFYDAEAGIYLNGRQVVGRCPVQGCKSEKGYADECDLGHSYAPEELIAPRSTVTGTVPEMRPVANGYGFLRTSGYLPGETDCYVGTALIKRNGLRKGDYVEGQTRPARENEKFAAIQKIMRVNGVPVEELGNRPRFADLTPVYPEDRLVMEHGHNTTTARVIDLVAPIGKGQRGLIVSPPKAGKTTILKDIAAAIHANNPEVHLMCLLVDERPEEVTDMQRSIHGEVISSTFDMPADNHIAVAEMVIERAKRLVETGADVVILLDSITRLARAYNLAQPASGRVLSGGVDSTALYPPKRFLGAARNIENGGSLTILASALIETGSKMDEVIFEEFKGTGNMELRLDRALADRRIFPAIDPVASGTRKEDLLLDPQMAPIIWAVRRILANMNNTERAMDMLIKSIKQTDDNQEFLLRMARKAQHGKTETLEL